MAGDSEALSPGQIAEQLIAEARSNGALVLRLADLGLTDLPPSLFDLQDLTFLDIAGNQLTALPDNLAHLGNLEALYAERNQIRALPKGIFALEKLEALGLWNNNLSILPGVAADSATLTELDLDGNNLTSLPESFDHLTGLQELRLRGNALTVLPKHLGRLTQLSTLDLGNNQLSALPESMRRMSHLETLALDDNPGLGIPPEVLEASPARILEYYFTARAGRRPLNEAKMILVGRGGVGKTSLINRLVHNRFNSTETKTDGISITPWSIKVGKDDVRLNIWDFGGQEIMHATHQFFLTKRSLYLLILNAREGEQDANVEYWLQLIESFGADSPVLIVINKIKEHPFDLNRRGIQAKFPSVRGIIQTDCDAEIGLDELRTAILRETDQLEHLRDAFPTSWFTIKNTLADLPRNEHKNFIPFERYQQICADNGVDSATAQETLVGFLHDLGIVVNFREDPRLSETHVLNPEWVTNGIYKILNAESLARKQGELRVLDLGKVLDNAEYPKSMHTYLVDLMRKFELCYEFYDTAGHYLVPELLGKEEPELEEFDAPDALRFEYHYNIVPEGMLPRFIVRSRALNRDLPRWRTGVVLAWDGNRALVKADVQGKRVSIAVIGPHAGRRRLLTVIRADMEYLHRSVPKLQPLEQVPAPGHAGLVVPFKKLQTLEAKGRTEFDEVFNDEVITFSVSELLNGVEEPRAKSDVTSRGGGEKEALRLAFSYSSKDVALRDQLETHLKLLQRQGVISAWHDRQILPGEAYAGVIDDHFERAEIILLLISADFLASDYCYELEMQKSLSRSSARYPCHPACMRLAKRAIRQVERPAER